MFSGVSTASIVARTCSHWRATSYLSGGVADPETLWAKSCVFVRLTEGDLLQAGGGPAVAHRLGMATLDRVTASGSGIMRARAPRR